MQPPPPAERSYDKQLQAALDHLLQKLIADAKPPARNRADATEPLKRRPMKILTIETTCDETAAAVVTDELAVLSSVVASQDELHQRFAGVVPEIAARAHVERILPAIDEALRRAGVTLADLDAIAVANTPGLAGSLLVGLVAAKTLCVAAGKPLVAINHLHAHIYACRMAAGRDVFPCVGLIVSGGHTSLYRCPGRPISSIWAARSTTPPAKRSTRSPAMLGLPYPGGPAISRAAERAIRGPTTFPAAWPATASGWISASAA